MPTIIKPEDMSMDREGEGWRQTTLADARTIGAPAMVARRWSFQPGAIGPKLTHGEADQLLYVIRGSGVADVEGERMALETETVLWLEPGEHYHFEAGENGLEILQGFAPGEEM